MKEIRIEPVRRIRLTFAGLAVAVTVTGIAAFAGYGKLRDIYLEQCVITDPAEQVRITSGKMVHPNNIAEGLGLKTGANLATIDFKRKREELLANIPNLKDIRISRRLPDKVAVVAEERTPVARMNVRGGTGVTGRVADTEGMVFVWQRGTHILPTIREPQKPGTAKGSRLRGRSLAALRLIEAAREPGCTDLGILEVDTSKPDFLLATLGDYSKAKIAWEGMDEDTAQSAANLRARLANLAKAIRSKVANDTVIWNATLPEAIFADSQRKL
ncbi:MAG: FtsQ-type POTRA domain-containing protein [Kiritimatiellae bacterium]|nr:FtsQ-type POTRA domain-containing protein [Kiritimatiellia bacterium]